MRQARCGWLAADEGSPSSIHALAAAASKSPAPANKALP